jgi:plasmid maintenance system killer protein
MIRSFVDDRTEHLFRVGDEPSIPRDIAETALRRLDWLDAGSRLQDIAALKSLRLRKDIEAEAPGWYFVHVKDKWWLSFRWTHPDCFDVRIFQRR